MKYLLCAALLCAAAPQALATPTYLDDRSSPEQLIESLYNAINRHEYARAWDYYSTPPAKDFQTFAKGYEGTEEVQLTLGGVASEGAAGSTYYALPVAIRALDKQGKWKVFAGCYQLRQVNAANQDPPFRGLRIEKGSLKAATTDNPDEALPKSCGDVPLPSAAETLKAKVTAIFLREQVRNCDWPERYESGELSAEAHTLSFRYSYETADQPEHKVTLFIFPCGSGAYNTNEVYYTADDYGVISALSFAVPDYDFTYEDPEESTKLKSLTMRGFSVQSTLVNSGFDPGSNSISSFSKWRGIGDASSSGTWKFVEGRFILTDYAVDPTYDGEENQLTVLKDGVVVPVVVP